MKSSVEEIIETGIAVELTDLALSRFRGLAKEYFDIDVLQKPDYVKLLEESSIFYRFSLPAELNEEFILFEYAPLFWAYQSPLIHHIEDFLKKTLSQIGGQPFYKSVKEFYLKWLTIKSDEEKKYFATSTINYIDNKSNKNNFLHLIYHSMILAYDETLFNPEKAVTLLDKSLEIISTNNLNSDVKEEITYLINLYKGFVYLKLNNLEQAHKSFSDASVIKSDGINVKYFYSYSAFLLGNEPFPTSVLTDIINYDITRIEFAVENNDIKMLEYFIRFSTITNIFFYPEVAQSYQYISDFLSDIQGSTEHDLSVIKKDINNFKNLNMDEYYDEQIINNISFIEKFLKKYSDNKNILIIETGNKLHEKFVNTINLIINAIKGKYEVEIKTKLAHYDKQIHNKNNELTLIAREHEAFKVKLKKKAQETISNIENNTKANIAALEKKIENLHQLKNFNPNYSFKNGMTYNVILSSTIFLMGGCAGYSNNFLADYNKFGDFISVVLFSGIKWGVIAFSIGLIIATIYAGITVLESANQKQKLLQHINKLKSDKDSQINFCNKEVKESEELSEKRFKESNESIRKYLENLANEKQVQEKKFRDEVEQSIQNEAKALIKFL